MPSPINRVASFPPSLIKQLGERVTGEVRFDPYSKVLYSTDASIYQIDPLGVVIPRTREDVLAVIEIAHQAGLPVLPRGGGTSLAGQAVGKAIHIDLSKYLNRVVEVNPLERWVRVEPGVVLDELNAYLRPYKLMFGPDVATSNRANIGGMIGNNSCGAHSILYGKTIDHVQELQVVLANGQETCFTDLAAEALQEKSRQDDREGYIYREVQRIVETNRLEIEARYPRIMRRVGGYNLDAFIRDRPFNLSRLVVGSEGTLVMVLEARLKLVPTPAITALDLIHCNDLIEAMEAVPVILESQPAAVEMIDRMIHQLSRDTLGLSRTRMFLEGDPEALLVVEFYGESEAELVHRMEQLEQRLKQGGLGYAYVRAIDSAQQQNVWNMRKAGLGLLMGRKGDRKPISFVEDTAVAPDKLPAYIRRFRQIVADHQTTAAYYGHASVGCLHIRPLIDLKQATDIERMRSIAEQISDLVLEFGGALSAEHGDGLARSCFNEKMFGPVLYQAFREVKGAFDPQGIMNPGKIIDAPPMTDNLRYGAGYQTIPWTGHYDFSRDGGFARSVELCNGVGACRKKQTGTMCPSYRVTREEMHSTRGRANLLRAALAGLLPANELTSPRMYQVFDLCIECKGCKGECPSNVDMAKFKGEFLANYYAHHGVPLRARLFGHIALINRLGCALAPLANRLMDWKLTRGVLDRWLGIDRRRSFPPFARETFTAWFKKQPLQANNGKKGTVVLFHDTFMIYNYPQIGQAATRLLQQAGWRVVLARKKCCGRPLISKGLLDQARAKAAYNVARLAPYATQGYPIVGCEPSCILTLRDEYPDLLQNDQVQQVAGQIYTLEEFLWQQKEAGQLDLKFKVEPTKNKLLVHGHCHQKALVGMGPLKGLLEWAGYEVTDSDTGCCGMAGSFGFEKEHYDLSLAIGEQRLFKQVRARPEGTQVVAVGVSCRQQLAHGTGVQALHPAQILLQALAD